MERSRRQRAMEGLLLDGTVWFNVSFLCTRESLAIQSSKHRQKLFEQPLASSQHARITSRERVCQMQYCANILALACSLRSLS
jgi:hypothetical protein